MPPDTLFAIGDVNLGLNRDYHSHHLIISEPSETYKSKLENMGMGLGWRFPVRQFCISEGRPDLKFQVGKSFNRSHC